jgi:hypothetical protein
MGGTGSGRKKKILASEIEKKSKNVKKQPKKRRERTKLIQIKNEIETIEIKQEPVENQISNINTTNENEETLMLSAELESSFNETIQAVINQSETIINDKLDESFQLKTESSVNDEIDDGLVFGEPTIKMKSWVWKYYNPCPSEKLAKCKMCDAILARPLSSTSRLSNHLMKCKFYFYLLSLFFFY